MNFQAQKRLNYKQMLDAQVADNVRIAGLKNGGKSEMVEGSSSQLPPWRRMGGGGEPLRQGDGTIVANLRVFKRTANPNLPMGVEENGAEEEKYEKVSTMEVSMFSSPEPAQAPFIGVGGNSGDVGDASPRHVLFSHKYDSPEELESLALRRRKQSELKAVLENQMAEKRERKAREKHMRELEEEREEEEERLRYDAGQSAEATRTEYATQRPINTVDLSVGLAENSALSNINLSGDEGTDALGSLLNSPIHASLHSTSGDFHESAHFNEALASHKEEREVLLRTIKDQDKEIESLLSKLQGVKEGRQLFVNTMVPESPSFSRVETKSFAIYSPVKRSTALSSSELDLTVASELSSSSEYVPLGGSSSTFYKSVSPQKSVVSSDILQSSFGLTDFQKTYNQNQYDTRKEEALESFLEAFKEGVLK